MSKRDFISCPDAPAAIGPYSQGVRVGPWLFISGQIPIDLKNGELIEGGIVPQTEMVLNNIKNILIFCGLGIEDVVKVTVYLKDLNDFGKFNEVYGRFFSLNSPARAAVEVSNLPKDSLVEIDVIAYR